MPYKAKNTIKVGGKLVMPGEPVDLPARSKELAELKELGVVEKVSKAEAPEPEDDNSEDDAGDTGEPDAG